MPESSELSGVVPKLLENRAASAVRQILAVSSASILGYGGNNASESALVHVDLQNGACAPNLTNPTPARCCELGSMLMLLRWTAAAD